MELAGDAARQYLAEQLSRPPSHKLFEYELGFLCLVRYTRDVNGKASPPDITPQELPAGTVENIDKFAHAQASLYLGRSCVENRLTRSTDRLVYSQDFHARDAPSAQRTNDMHPRRHPRLDKDHTQQKNQDALTPA